MAIIDFLGIKARNLKALGEVAQGFDQIRPMNIIIGRNNTGKTALLDAVAFAHRPSDHPDLGHRDKSPTVELAFNVRGELAKQLRELPSIHKYRMTFSTCFENRLVTWRADARSDEGLTDTIAPETYNDVNANGMRREIRSHTCDVFRDMKLIRLSADRDIKPEKRPAAFPAITQPDLSHRGDGATAIMTYLLTNAVVGNVSHSYRRLVEATVLEELNQICGLDGGFKRIHALHTSEEMWEIFLDDKRGTSVPISRMGSGVKTILLVLLALLVYPVVFYKMSLDKVIFLFEELENNLHPAVQKRLFRYLTFPTECRP